VKKADVRFVGRGLTHVETKVRGVCKVGKYLLRLSLGPICGKLPFQSDRFARNSFLSFITRNLTFRALDSGLITPIRLTPPPLRRTFFSSDSSRFQRSFARSLFFAQPK